MLRRLSRGLARLVGLIFTALGVWLLAANLISVDYSGWTLAWIVAASALGAAGGILYLLSFGGDARFANRRTRLIGWIGMLVLALLPTSLSLPLLALLLATAPTLLLPFGEDDSATAS